MAGDVGPQHLRVELVGDALRFVEVLLGEGDVAG
jgi:hypothetical protein